MARDGSWLSGLNCDGRGKGRFGVMANRKEKKQEKKKVHEAENRRRKRVTEVSPPHHRHEVKKNLATTAGTGPWIHAR